MTGGFLDSQMIFSKGKVVVGGWGNIHGGM